MKYLGIDYGKKRIGIAQSDESGTIAFPLSTIEAGKSAAAQVATLAKENRIEKIVIGDSYDFKGDPNAVMKEVEMFKKEVAELSGLPTEYEPEFMTSAQAGRVGEDKRGEGGMEKSDASAAALILQGYLDKNK